MDLAEAWMPDWRSRLGRSIATGEERLLLARFLIADKRFDEAGVLLDEDRHERKRSVRYLVGAEELKAVAALEAGEQAAPMLFEIALAKAETEGFVQLFAGDSQALGALGRSGDSGVLAPIAPLHHLLVQQRVPAAERPARSNGAALVEPLTDREIAVLHYLPTRLTNKEIAAELFVSINTIKSHLKAIYRKLDVSRRNEAVARAVDARLV